MRFWLSYEVLLYVLAVELSDRTCEYMRMLLVVNETMALMFG